MTRFYTVSIRLKSGKSWDILSPVFLRAKPKRKLGRPPKRQTGALRHLGLEILGIIKHISPALVETCIAGSAIFLDEAQILPLKLLRPTMVAIDELARNYKCSVELCTATQPAFLDSDDFRNGFKMFAK